MVKLKCLGKSTTEMGLYYHKEVNQLQENFELVVDGLEEIPNMLDILMISCDDAISLYGAKCKQKEIRELLSKLKGDPKCQI